MFDKWMSDYNDELIVDGYNTRSKKKKQKKDKQDEILSDDDEFTNIGSAKRTIKEVLTAQQKYWECAAENVKRYAKVGQNDDNEKW